MPDDRAEEERKRTLAVSCGLEWTWQVGGRGHHAMEWLPGICVASWDREVNGMALV